MERPALPGDSLQAELSLVKVQTPGPRPGLLAVLTLDTAGNRCVVCVVAREGLTGDTVCYTRASLSNLVRLLVPAAAPPLVSASAQPSPAGQHSTDWVMVTAMSACLGALFLVSILCILFLFLAARRSRPASPAPSSDTGKEDQTDSSSCDSRSQGSYQPDKAGGRELQEMMADQHRIVPVYWSASQLLSKLEQQRNSEQQLPPQFRGKDPEHPLPMDLHLFACRRGDGAGR